MAMFVRCRRQALDGVRHGDLSDPKIGLGEISLGKVSAAQARAPKVSPDQACAGQIGSAKVRTEERGPIQLGPDQFGAVQDRGRHVSVGQVATRQGTVGHVHKAQGGPLAARSSRNKTLVGGHNHVDLALRKFSSSE